MIITLWLKSRLMLIKQQIKKQFQVKGFAVAHDSKEINQIKTHVFLTYNDDTKQSDDVDNNNIDAQYKRVGESI